MHAAAAAAAAAWRPLHGCCMAAALLRPFDAHIVVTYTTHAAVLGHGSTTVAKFISKFTHVTAHSKIQYPGFLLFLCKYQALVWYYSEEEEGAGAGCGCCVFVHN